MKNNLDNQEEEFRYDGIYRAIVVANEDPRDIGRIKVHVPAVYPDNMEIGLYPWAKPAVSPYNSGGENKIDPNVLTEKGKTKSYEDEKFDKPYNELGTGGIFTVPNKGNTVFVWFDQGNHMYPYYFAMEPKEGDWLQQKVSIKDKINEKIVNITSFIKKFVPEHGSKGENGTDWADGAYVNTRQKVSSKGETLGGRTTSENLGDERIKGGDYKPTKVNHSNADKDGQTTENMKKVVERARSNTPTLDVKPLFDKEDGQITRKVVKEAKDVDYDKNPHVYSQDWTVDDTIDNERNINRYVTSIMTEGGTSIIIDHREGQENYYFIHKGYMQNVDQHGSVKEYVGTHTNDDGTEERCDKELGVEGDNKIHVLGNFVTYVKGNKLTQIDKNLQIDVNDSCGIRMKKGDFDIVLNGEKASDRDDNKDSKREEGKEEQYGDLNIDIQNGNMDVHVKNNCNIHVEGNTNLKVDGSMKMDVAKDFSLKVGGKAHLVIGGGLFVDSSLDISKAVKMGQSLDVGGGIKAASDVTTGKVSLNSHVHEYSWNWKHGGGSSSRRSDPAQSGGSSPSSPTDASPEDATREHNNR